MRIQTQGMQMLFKTSLTIQGKENGATSLSMTEVDLTMLFFFSLSLKMRETNFFPFKKVILGTVLSAVVHLSSGFLHCARAPSVSGPTPSLGGNHFTSSWLPPAASSSVSYLLSFLSAFH